MGNITSLLGVISSSKNAMIEHLEDDMGLTIAGNKKLENISDTVCSIGVSNSTKLTLTPDDVGSTGYDIGSTYFKDGTVIQPVIDNSFTAGAGVRPNDEEQMISPKTSAYMTAVRVQRVPVSNPTAQLSQVITTKSEYDSATTKQTLVLKASGTTTDEPVYMQTATVPKVVIDAKSVDYEDLYTGVSEDYVISASADDFNGFSTVTIPRPTVVTEFNDYSVDLLNLDIGTTDNTIPVNAGYYHGGTITLETVELYEALCNI